MFYNVQVGSSLAYQMYLHRRPLKICRLKQWLWVQPSQDCHQAIRYYLQPRVVKSDNIVKIAPREGYVLLGSGAKQRKPR
jgi:hypothetical protein